MNTADGLATGVPVRTCDDSTGTVLFLSPSGLVVTVEFPDGDVQAFLAEEVEKVEGAP